MDWIGCESWTARILMTITSVFWCLVSKIIEIPKSELIKELDDDDSPHAQGIGREYNFIVLYFYYG